MKKCFISISGFPLSCRTSVWYKCLSPHPVSQRSNDIWIRVATLQTSNWLTVGSRAAGATGDGIVVKIIRFLGRNIRIFVNAIRIWIEYIWIIICCENLGPGLYFERENVVIVHFGDLKCPAFYYIIHGLRVCTSDFVKIWQHSIK